MSDFPKKRPKTHVSVEIDAELLDTLRAIAKRRSVTLRSLIEYGLKLVIQALPEPSNPPDDTL